MFNLSKLKIVNPSLDDGCFSSFVGIRKGYTNELEFCLPKGFEQFDPSYENLKRLFFSMYATFKKFEEENIKNIDSYLDKKSQNKDNVKTIGEGYKFRDSEDNDVVLYSKILLIESMLEAYADLSLNDISISSVNAEEINYDLIEYYLDKAIYLENDMIYIENMESTNKTIKYDSTELTEMFCFVIKEIFSEMQKKIDTKVSSLAFNFSAKFLTSESKLFDEFTFESTIETLKSVLDIIDKNTAYKDNEYWLLFNAIESFLYGDLDTEHLFQDGKYWGINNFYQIWEDICNKNLFLDYKNEILHSDDKIIYCDTKFNYPNENLIRKKFGGSSVLIDKNFKNPFIFSLGTKKRWMRPDVVVERFSNIEKAYNSKIITINYASAHNSGRSDITVKLSHKASTYQKNLFERLYSHIASIKGQSVQGARILPKKHNSNIFELKNFSIEFFKQIINLPIDVFYKKKAKNSIIDWKYLSTNFFKSNSSKLKNDVSKQLAYEFCIKQMDIFKNKIFKVDHQYGIPFYSDSDSIYIPLNSDDFSSLISDNSIEVIGVNFFIAQSRYLEND